MDLEVNGVRCRALIDTGSLKIMRKIGKGASEVCRPLKQLDEDGNLVLSDYEIVGSLENESRDLLLAFLPSANETTELYRFPFVRLTVRKVTDVPVDGHSTSVCESEEPTLKSISDRLDQLTSTVASLADSATPNRRSSRATTVRKSFTNGHSTPPIKLSSPEDKKPSVSSAKSKGRSPNPIIAKASATLPHTHLSDSSHSLFTDRLNDTIDDVLSCIRRGKDGRLFDGIKAKLFANLDALPPPSAQIVESTAEVISHAKSPSKINPRKRTVSSDFLDQPCEIAAPSPTKMRFTPITHHASISQNDRLNSNNPTVVHIRSEEDELNDLLESLARKEAAKDARQEVKNKIAWTKRHQQKSSQNEVS
ncbi:unnamed protein product [Echinostoma caproni]|uniref:Uncharacterized protein n=1 Tax=Echinostoma caproni TaxID=27848 RepID=A0A183APF0_9TREM|nr:unnamed protein product [Echinostoma caproni]